MIEALKCNDPECGFEATPDGHKVEMKGTQNTCRCGKCGKHIKNLPQNNDRKRRKTTTTGFRRDYCEMCGRTSGLLPDHQQLEVHHKVPLEEGGEDIEGNLIMVCTPCHALIHHQRDYVNRHMKDHVRIPSGASVGCTLVLYDRGNGERYLVPVPDGSTQ